MSRNPNPNPLFQAFTSLFQGKSLSLIQKFFKLPFLKFWVESQTPSLGRGGCDYGACIDSKKWLSFKAFKRAKKRQNQQGQFYFLGGIENTNHKQHTF